MKIHHFIKDSIAMAENEANAIKELEQFNKEHESRNEHSDTDVTEGGLNQRTEEEGDTGSREGGQEAPTRPTQKKKKAKKDVQGQAKKA